MSSHLQNLHKRSFNNRLDLSLSSKAACFHCVRTFAASRVVNFNQDFHGHEHGLCPFCGHDTVVGDVLVRGSFSIKTVLSKEDFVALNEYYVTDVSLISASTHAEISSQEVPEV